MRYLLISDIHSNWEALQAVVADAAGQFDRILCCGDLVGYGADPDLVVDWTRANVGPIVRGNHDRVMGDAEALEWFNPVARAAILWTRQTMSPANLEYAANLPKGPLHCDAFTLAHGTPLDEDEYVSNDLEAQMAFAYVERPVTFFGHTHVQCAFQAVRRSVQAFRSPRRQAREWALDLDPGSWYLVNPGSVGQPRDRDPRAAYALYEPESREVLFRRAAYDIAAAQRKIQAAGLPEPLASRLAGGR